MQIFHHAKSLRNYLVLARQRGQRIGFVPTMGNLHPGHLSLIEMAKAHSDVVVASIFVNRMQFGLNEDFDHYPRTLAEDCQQLVAAGCDVLFTPDEREIYPNGMAEQTQVLVPGLSDVLCGASRPGHFAGVTTVVAKLFNIVQPELAVFGLKDFQQFTIIKRMTADLCWPITLLGAPTAREPDGLAMSSRNRYLSDAERQKAAGLYRTLRAVATAIELGERDYYALEQAARLRIESMGFRPDYVAVRQSESLAVPTSADSRLTIFGALYTGQARLIDNLSLELPIVA